MDAVKAALLKLIETIEASGKEMSVEVQDALSEIHAAYCAPDAEEDHEDNLSDVEADAQTLASAGMGVDEDYGYFGDGEEFGGNE